MRYFCLFFFCLTLIQQSIAEDSSFQAESLKMESVPKSSITGTAWPENSEFSSGLKCDFAKNNLRILTSDRELFLQARIPCANAPKALTTEPDRQFGREDALVLSLDPNLAGLNFLKIGWNPNLIKMDGESYSFKRNFTTRQKSERDGNNWILTVGIDLKSIGVKPEKGSLLGLKAERLTPSGKKEQLKFVRLALNSEALPLRFCSEEKRLSVYSDSAVKGEAQYDRDGIRNVQKLHFQDGKAVVTLPLDTIGDLPLTLICQDRSGHQSVNYAMVEFFQDWYGGKARGALLRLPKTKATEDSVFWTGNVMDKILPNSQLPKKSIPALSASLAGNEYEGMVLHVTPRADQNYRVSFLPFRSKEGHSFSAENIQLFQLGTVPVTKISDKLGHRGEWPDPLIPLKAQKESFLCRGGVNNSLYLQAYVPAGTPGGLYNGKVVLTAESGKIEIPVQLKIYSFALPTDTEMKTLYAIWGHFYPWQKLTSKKDQEEHLIRYFELLSRYRLNPGNAFRQVTIPYKNGKCDFSEFDKRAEIVFNRFHFDPVNLAYFLLQPPFRFENQPKSPEAKETIRKAYSQVIEHLKEKGWLEKCIWYDVDEPAPPTYPKVRKHLDMTRELLPGLRRLVVICHSATAPELEGAVETWVPILNLYKPEYWKTRREKGEEVWWYVCNFPQAPYPSNFIDVPGIMPRIRFWMAEKYGVTGSLYWAVDYLGKNQSSTTRNPWKDPLIFGLTNGDGMLLYPPSKTPSEKPCLDAPWPSIRLEQIRDGLEDREYFRLARRELARLKRIGKAPDVQARLEKMITEAPSLLVKTPSVYEREPDRLLEVRNALAQLLESSAEIK